MWKDWNKSKFEENPNKNVFSSSWSCSISKAVNMATLSSCCACGPLVIAPNRSCNWFRSFFKDSIKWSLFWLALRFAKINLDRSFSNLRIYRKCTYENEVKTDMWPKIPVKRHKTLFELTCFCKRSNSVSANWSISIWSCEGDTDFAAISQQFSLAFGTEKCRSLQISLPPRVIVAEFRHRDLDVNSMQK